MKEKIQRTLKKRPKKKLQNNHEKLADRRVFCLDISLLVYSISLFIVGVTDTLPLVLEAWVGEVLPSTVLASIFIHLGRRRGGREDGSRIPSQGGVLSSEDGSVF